MPKKLGQKLWVETERTRYGTGYSMYPLQYPVECRCTVKHKSSLTLTVASLLAAGGADKEQAVRLATDCSQVRKQGLLEEHSTQLRTSVIIRRWILSQRRIPDPTVRQ